LGLVIDKSIENKLLITVAPDGYLRCVKYWVLLARGHNLFSVEAGDSIFLPG